MIAFVRGVIFRSTSAGSRLSVTGSMSAKTGVAPMRAIDSAVAKKVKAGQMTSSPRPIPSASSTITSASVPFATPTVSRHAEVLGGLALELRDVRPEDEPPVLEHGREGLLQLRDERRVLRLDVDERDLHGTGRV